MRSSQQIYQEVAEECSAYHQCCHENTFRNDSGSVPSCLNCTHFASDEHCKLDLYDPIASRIKNS